MNLLLLPLAQAAPADEALTTSGGVLMTFCILVVLSLNIFCLYRVLTTPNEPSDENAASAARESTDR